MKKSKKTKTPKKTKNVAFSSIVALSKSQQIISKTIRRKPDSFNKVIPMLESLSETVNSLIKLFKIKRKDINRIQLLKYKRLEDRITNGVLS